MLLKKFVELLRLPNGKVAIHNTGVVNTKNNIDVFHTLSSDIGQLLNFVCSIFDLLRRVNEEYRKGIVPTHLVISKLQLQLFDTTLDGIPSRKTVTG